MTSRPSPRSLAFVFTLLLAVAWVGAGGCGDRSLTPKKPDGGGAGAAGAGSGGDTGVAGTGYGPGAAGATGTTGGAGTTGSAGATVGSAGSTGTGGVVAGASGHAGGGGSTGGAGQGGAGGSQACGPCPDPGCKAGYMAVVDPHISCCPICRPVDCSQVMCPNLLCPSGWHIEPPPTGTCCGMCVQGPSAECTKAQATYGSERMALLAKYSDFPCRVDSDCKLVFEANACVSNCGEALSTTTAAFFASNIQSAADTCDHACPSQARPPCAQLVAVCSNGLCAAVPASGP